jgi:hypothetical protein
MKSLGYVLVLLAFVAAGIIWQVLRRVSAGTQALISPERYAIQKVVQMQQALPNHLQIPKDFPVEKWNALVKYDPEIAPLAEQLRPFGDRWVWILGRDYFALEEDRSYLPHMLARLMDEAQTEKAEEAEREAKRTKEEESSRFRQLYDGQLCDETSSVILSEAQRLGYVLDVESSRTIAASLPGRGTSFLRSNSDIKDFGQLMSRLQTDISKELSAESIAVLRRAKEKGYAVAFSPDKGSIVISSSDGWRTCLASNSDVLKFGRDLR